MVHYVSDAAAGAAQQPWWSPVEALDADAVHALQQSRLQTQYAYLRSHSPFYRRKFAAAGLGADAVQDIDDLQRVPFTTKQELRDSLKAAPPFGEHLAAPLSDVIDRKITRLNSSHH